MAERRIQKGLAEKLAQMVSRGAEVPVDLQELAESLGVTEILLTELVEDGRTTWIDGWPKIELRADRPTARMRFTLAHEIAHVLVAQDQTVARRTQGLDHDALEMLCDWIAASLLMPRDWMQRFANRKSYNLSLLRLIANHAGVSLSAAAVRLAEVGGRTCMLLRLQRAPERWVVVGHAGVPREHIGALEATEETSSLLDGLAGRRDVWQNLTLRSRGSTLIANAHLDKSGQTCIALITSISKDATH